MARRFVLFLIHDNTNKRIHLVKILMSAPRRLKILHFVYDHPENPWCGGGGSVRTWAVNKILAQRHDITVACGVFPGSARQDAPFKVRFLGKATGYVESRIKFIFESRKAKVDAYDLVVEDLSYYAPVLSRFSGRPTVTILHGRHGLDALRFRGIYGLVSLISEYLILPNRKAVIIVSEHLRSAVRPDARIAVIGLGTDIPNTLPPPTEEYVLFLGRLDIWAKGLDTLIRAWAQLSPDVQTLPLHIVGGGDENKVQALIKSTGARNLHLTGRVSHDKALDAINRAAFLCMPSRMEGFGLVAAEAVALGKPVIVSSIPSLKEIVPHGVSGLHVPVDDPGALSRAIQKLLSDLELRKRLAGGARKHGAKVSWEQIAEKQERFYWETINLKKTRVFLKR